MNTGLRRYTDLPYLIDLLMTKEIALLSPDSWDDRNDSYYIKQFAKANGLSSTYALCLAEASETYHHWRLFTNGSNGVCIEFDKAQLISEVRKFNGVEVRAEKVIYKKIDSLHKVQPSLPELPFLKRQAFGDEKEFRLFCGLENKGPSVFRLPISLKTINRITFSPWLAKSVFEQVKFTLKSIKGCKSLKIYKSSLVENEKWMNYARYVSNTDLDYK